MKHIFKVQVRICKEKKTPSRNVITSYSYDQRLNEIIALGKILSECQK